MAELVQDKPASIQVLRAAAALSVRVYLAIAVSVALVSGVLTDLVAKRPVLFSRKTISRDQWINSAQPFRPIEQIHPRGHIRG